MQEREVRIIALVGAPRSGKSYFANQRILDAKAAGLSTIVYNLGRQSDFSNAKPGALLGINEHLKILEKVEKKTLRTKLGSDELPGTKTYARNPDLLFYKLYGHPKADTMHRFKEVRKEQHADAVKFPRAEKKLEPVFFELVFQYFPRGLLIIDDCKNMFKEGLSAEEIQLFSRANHVGAGQLYPGFGYGCDIIFIAHSIDDINPQLFAYVNTYVMFQALNRPNFKNLENPPLEATLSKCFEELKTAPKYSYSYHPEPLINPEYYEIYTP